MRLAARTTARLGPAARGVGRAVAGLAAERVGDRLWAEDAVLWKRQGIPGTGSFAWLDVPEPNAPAVVAITTFAHEVRAAGLTQAVVCGIGPDVLPADVLRRCIGMGRGWLDLRVLDAGDPAAVQVAATRGDPGRTLYLLISSTPSLSAVLDVTFRLLWARAREVLGDAAGAHFAAVSSPGGPLESLAGEHGFRRVFRMPADLGGRWAALSPSGLVPAGLSGIDLTRLLERARRMAIACSAVVPPRHNPGLWLGATLGALAHSGRDKLTLILPDRLAAAGAWIEQLVAGATGKDGRGIVPVVGEPTGTPALYGKDRLFVHLRLGARQDRGASALAAAGHPVVTLGLNDAYDLGAEFVRWEIATAVAARLLDVHPFAEPQGIELDAAARRALSDTHEPDTPPLTPSSPDFAARLGTRLAAARGRRWVALAAYVSRTPRRERLLADIRVAIRKRFGVATTLAFGSAALHATGQLHAAGPPTLIALDITADEPADALVPGASYGLTAVQRAEAIGRTRVLLAHNRPIVHVDLGRQIEAGLSAMLLALQRRPAPPRSRPATRRKPVATRARAGRRR